MVDINQCTNAVVSLIMFFSISPPSILKYLRVPSIFLSLPMILLSQLIPKKYNPIMARPLYYKTTIPIGININSRQISIIFCRTRFRKRIHYVQYHYSLMISSFWFFSFPVCYFFENEYYLSRLKNF